MPPQPRAPHPSSPPDPWWVAFYDELYADLFLTRDARQLGEVTQFLIQSLNITPGDRVLDQCCGTGQIAVALARRGARVIAVDQCDAYLRRAEATARDIGVSCTFVRADAFEYAPDEPCAAAFNWHTSFGYAEDDQNLRMLERAGDALEPGGRFALDCPHADHLLRNFRRRIEYRHDHPTGPVVVTRESELDARQEHLLQRWTFETVRGLHVRESRLRLYSPDQLAGLLRLAGFGEVDFRGGVRDEVLGPDAPRCICLARKTAT